MPLSQPELNAVAFAVNSTLKNTIPATTSTRGAASFDKGFPPETMVKKLAGGIAPSGYDFNGILNFFGKHQVWQNAGGKYKFNSTIANALGGYHKGAVLISDDGLRLYVSTVDGNMNNLNNVLTGWALIATSEFENIINTEKNDRISSDNLLNNKIDYEILQRENADNLIRQSLFLGQAIINAGDFIGSRALSTAYINNTPYPKVISITSDQTVGNTELGGFFGKTPGVFAKVAGGRINSNVTPGGCNILFIVPPQYYYKVEGTGLTNWFEY